MILMGTWYSFQVITVLFSIIPNCMAKYLIGISMKCPFSFHHLHSTMTIYNYLVKMHQCQMKSKMNSNSIHFSKMHSEQSMILILTSTAVQAQLIKKLLGIAKGIQLKTALQYAALTWLFTICSLGGRGPQQIQQCFMMLVSLICPSLLENTTLLTQDFPQPLCLWFLSVENITILGSGAVPTFSMSIYVQQGLLLMPWLHRPQNAEELFNLQHASACNVIEYIFGVLKSCFHILVHPPQFDMHTQAVRFLHFY